MFYMTLNLWRSVCVGLVRKIGLTPNQVNLLSQAQRNSVYPRSRSLCGSCGPKTYYFGEIYGEKHTPYLKKVTNQQWKSSVPTTGRVNNTLMPLFIFETPIQLCTGSHSETSSFFNDTYLRASRMHAFFLLPLSSPSEFDMSLSARNVKPVPHILGEPNHVGK